MLYNFLSKNNENAILCDNWLNLTYLEHLQESLFVCFFTPSFQKSLQGLLCTWMGEKNMQIYCNSGTQSIFNLSFLLLLIFFTLIFWKSDADEKPNFRAELISSSLLWDTGSPSAASTEYLLNNSSSAASTEKFTEIIY